MNVAVGIDWESFELYAGKACITMNDLNLFLLWPQGEKERENSNYLRKF